jgi:Mpv17 / PMP22 family
VGRCDSPSLTFLSCRVSCLSGLCFGPLVHQYYQFSDYILPVEAGLANRIQKVIMDQTIYLVVKCSIYISAVGLLAGDDWETCQQRVKDKIGGVVITAWKFWPLVHCITYSVIPARHRILWVNCVDLIWNAILATKAQKDPPQTAELSEATDESGTLVFETKSVDDNEVIIFVKESSSLDQEAVQLIYTTTEPANSTSMEVTEAVVGASDSLRFNTTFQGK